MNKKVVEGTFALVYCIVVPSVWSTFYGVHVVSITCPISPSLMYAYCGYQVGQAIASAIKRGVARAMDAPDAIALDAANAFNRAKPALPASVVVDGRLIDIKSVVSRTEVTMKEKEKNE